MLICSTVSFFSPYLQSLELGELKQRIHELTEVKAQLEARNQKLLEESTYAKGLASAAGVELKALSEEVTKLMNQNEKLASEMASLRSPTPRRVSNGPRGTARRESMSRRNEPAGRRDGNAREERERALETILAEKEQKEAELQRKVEESKQKEAFLESELANMWVLVAKLKKSRGDDDHEDLEAKYNGS